MASRSPPSSKRGQREDNNGESRHRKKLEKGKESVAKDAYEEPLFDDNKFAAELLTSAFRKLQGVGEAFDIKAHHDVYKDPTLKGLTFRIHGLAEKLENPDRICWQLGRQRLSFLYWLVTLTRGPITIFLE
jgi:hypothetical protein